MLLGRTESKTKLNPICSAPPRSSRSYSSLPWGRVAYPFALFLFTNAHGWMIPLQYVNTEELVWFFGRVPHPLWFSEGGGLDSATTGKAEVGSSKIPTLAKTARMGHPTKACGSLRGGVFRNTGKSHIPRSRPAIRTMEELLAQRYFQ
jgi:hypothetical protein